MGGSSSSPRAEHMTQACQSELASGLTSATQMTHPSEQVQWGWISECFSLGMLGQKYFPLLDLNLEGYAFRSTVAIFIYPSGPHWRGGRGKSLFSHSAPPTGNIWKQFWLSQLGRRGQGLLCSSSQWRPRMLLNKVQRTGQPHNKEFSVLKHQ